LKISFILLAHNEEKNIEKDIYSLKKKVLDKLNKSEYELIISEDGSVDGTKKKIKNLRQKINFKYFSSTKRKGVCKAMYDSFKIAKGDYVFFSDSGQKFNFIDFWKLYPFIKKFDVVSGLRINRMDQIYRRILTKFFNIFLRALLNSPYIDIDSGFKVFRTKALKKILLKKPINTDFFSAEICLKLKYLGYSCIEVPVRYNQRNDISKALPIYKIPLLIYNFLKNFRSLKKELNCYLNKK
jgi:glycosyltransferase involved in cell wall biosynthesis